MEKKICHGSNRFCRDWKKFVIEKSFVMDKKSLSWIKKKVLIRIKRILSQTEKEFCRLKKFCHRKKSFVMDKKRNVFRG